MLKSIKKYANRALSVGYRNAISELKEEMKDTHGQVTISKIGFEAIGILVLVVIWLLIPFLGNAISSSIPAADVNSAWANAPNGAEMWTSVAPILQTAVVVAIVGLILKTVYDLKQNRE